MKIANLLRAAVVAVVLVSTVAPVSAAATKHAENPQLKAAKKRAKAQRKAQRRFAKKLQKQRKAMAQH